MIARGITKALGGMWTGSYGLVRCPAHDDRKPSLKISDDPDKRDGIDLICFAGCDWRNVKSALQQQGLLDGARVSAPQQRQPRSTPLPDDEKRRIEFALRLWQQSVPLTNTLGWRYFTERRGLHVGLLDDLSHALRRHEGIQAVVGLMTNPISNEPIGIHRTFLNPDGTKRERKMLGRAGVIRLTPNEEVTHGLGICEGIEDGLAVLLSGWSPVWATASAGGVERFPVLPGIESLTIFADYEEVGMNAAVTCCNRWEAADRQVAIQEPQLEQS